MLGLRRKIFGLIASLLALGLGVFVAVIASSVDLPYGLLQMLKHPIYIGICVRHPIQCIFKAIFNRDQLQASPKNYWSTKTIPSYGFWNPEKGWQVRIHGQIVSHNPYYALPEIDSTINSALIRASITPQKGYKKHFQLLTAPEAALARSRFLSWVNVRPIGGMPMAVELPLCDTSFPLDHATTIDGDFDDYVSIADSLLDCPLTPGDLTNNIQEVNFYPFPRNHMQIAEPNGDPEVLTQLVPPTGLTVITDIDDVLRTAEVWNIKQTLLYIVAGQYIPWLNMPEIFRRWKRDVPGIHFHYRTDNFDVDAPYYVTGTHEYYPRGSFGMRTLNDSTTRLIQNARYQKTKELIEAFPNRKFMLMGDTSSGTTTTAYPKLMHEFPDQVQCILIRDTRATEPADWMTADTWRFRKMPYHKYMFYALPKSLGWVSSDHLNRIARGEAEGCFPPGVIDRDGVPTKVKDSMVPNKIRGQRIWSLFRGLWYFVKCTCIIHRPSQSCPFDRRPGTVFRNGEIEPEHDKIIK